MSSIALPAPAVRTFKLPARQDRDLDRLARAECRDASAVLRELVAGGSVPTLRTQAAAILRRIDSGRPRAPGEDDE